MESLKLRENFYWTGIVDDNLRVFDIIMYTEFGTTYNSYVMKAGDKTVLFETAKAKFFDEYLEKLKELTDVTKIDYLVVSHTEPDHAGSVEKLLEINPGMKIIATGCAVNFLKEIVNGEFTAIVVKDNQEMKIGDKTLKFLVVPNLHWPDTMYTYIEEEQILVTCDSFGSHYGFHDILVSKVTDHEGYMRATKYYFDNIIGPFSLYHIVAAHINITALLDTLGNGFCQLFCIAISAYIGNNYCFSRIWINYGTPFFISIQHKINSCIQNRSMTCTNHRNIQLAGTHGGKLASAFGSYGWSGEAVPHLIERLKQRSEEHTSELQSPS